MPVFLPSQYVCVYTRTRIYVYVCVCEYPSMYMSAAPDHGSLTYHSHWTVTAWHVTFRASNCSSLLQCVTLIICAIFASLSVPEHQTKTFQWTVDSVY